jgi:hypothetical protein
MTTRPIPRRHWRSYGDAPLPSGREALDQPLSAFPSWFMRITCDRCGKDRMLNEAHTTGRRREMPIRDLIAKARQMADVENLRHELRHDGCGGRAGRTELRTGIEGASSRPVRKIVLIAER